MLANQEKEFIVNRLVKKFDPDKIILFGSQARSDSNPQSDVDLLILTNRNSNRRKLTIDMDKVLKGLNYSRDIIILSLDEFERDKLIAGTIARYAYLEGQILYERQ